MTRRKRRHQSHDSYDEYENELQDEYDDEYDSDEVDDDSDYDSEADDDDAEAGPGKRRKFAQMLSQTAVRREVKLGLAALLVFIGVGGLVTAYFMRAPVEGDLVADAEVAVEDGTADSEGATEPDTATTPPPAAATPAAYEATPPAVPPAQPQSSPQSSPQSPAANADSAAADMNDRYGLRSGQRYPDVTSAGAGDRYGATPSNAPTSSRETGGRYGDRVSVGAAGNPPEPAATQSVSPRTAPTAERTAPTAEPSAPQAASPTAPTRSAEPPADRPPSRYNFDRSPRADLPQVDTSATTAQPTSPQTSAPQVERPAPPTVLPREQRPAATPAAPAAQPRETMPARVATEPPAATRPQTPATQGDERPYRRFEDARIRVPNESEAPQVRTAAPQRPLANSFESAPAGTSSSHSSELPTHRVQQGDNYWHIATQEYGQGEYFKALYEHNRRRYNRSSLLRVGDVVETPPVDYLIRMYPELCPRQAIGSGASSGVATGGGERTYVVQAGETLYDIARRELGEAARWQEIYQLNRSQLNADFENPAAGTSLRLPGR